MALIMCAVLAVGFQDFMVARHNPHPRTNEFSAQPADAESSAGSGGDDVEWAGSGGAESAGSDGVSRADTVSAASGAAKTPAVV
jgi:hypothetical protein